MPAAASSGAISSTKMCDCRRSTSSEHPGPDGPQRLARAQPVGGTGPQPGVDLVLQTGHPHLEELVEPFGEDGQELDPLEQGQRSSSASSSSRAPNSSHESSRLVNRCGPSSYGLVTGGPDAAIVTGASPFVGIRPADVFAVNEDYAGSVRCASGSTLPEGPRPAVGQSTDNAPAEVSQLGCRSVPTLLSRRLPGQDVRPADRTPGGGPNSVC